MLQIYSETFLKIFLCPILKINAFKYVNYFSKSTIISIEKMPGVGSSV